MTVLLKAVHIGALAIWCAGLVALPGLFNWRRSVADDAERFKLQRIARALFIAVASPAAFVTVASGTTLIFLRPVLEPWMALKMVLVGLLAAIHVWTGLVVIRVFKPDSTYGRWRAPMAATVTTLVATGILWVVLAKPVLDPDGIAPAGLMEPGRLGEIIRSAYHRLRS